MVAVHKPMNVAVGPVPIDGLLMGSHTREKLEVPDSIRPLRENPTILVVEDDDLTRQITVRELGRQFRNAVFIEARSGREAVERLSAPGVSVDCMVLDFCLGDKPGEIHGEGVLAYLGEKRIVCPTVVRSGSWSNPETVMAREQITEGIIRGVYTNELRDREVRQIGAVPGLPVLVDFMGKGDNFDILAARLDIVRLHSGREAQKLGQNMTPLEGVVGALIKDILAGLNVGRRETTPTRYWISRLEGAGNDFNMYFGRFAKKARQSGEYQSNGCENLRNAVETVEKENALKRFSFENLMVTAGSSHPNAHALLNRLMLCRDLVQAASKEQTEIGGLAREVAPELTKAYDSALKYYRNSKTRERTDVNVADFMKAALAGLSAVHGIPVGYKAPWGDVGTVHVDPVLFNAVVSELVTNACKAAKQAEKPEAGIVGSDYAFSSLPAGPMSFFRGKGIEGGSVIDLIVYNNGPPIDDSVMEALNRGDTSKLGSSTFGTGGTGLKSLMEDMLPNLPGALAFEKRGGQTSVSLFVPPGKAVVQEEARPPERMDSDVGPRTVRESDAPEPAVRSGGPPKARVILVDDFEEFPKGLKGRIDEIFGDKVEVVVCTTVKQFLAASEKPFDALVTDYVLEASHLEAAVLDEEKGRGRTGRTLCRIARQRNPSALTVIYSIDDVYDPSGPGAAAADPNMNAPADPANTDWGVNKSTSELMISDGKAFKRPTPAELGKLGIEPGEHWGAALIRILEPRITQKQTV
jgi:hypothetical protein